MSYKSRDICEALDIPWDKANFHNWPQDLNIVKKSGVGEVYSIRLMPRLLKENVETIVALKVGGFYVVILPKGLIKI